MIGPGGECSRGSPALSKFAGQLGLFRSSMEPLAFVACTRYPSRSGIMGMVSNHERVCLICRLHLRHPRTVFLLVHAQEITSGVAPEGIEKTNILLTDEPPLMNAEQDSASLMPFRALKKDTQRNSSNRCLSYCLFYLSTYN